MADINLLPWREARRAKINKNILILSCILWGMCMFWGLVAIRSASGDLAYQHVRNRYLLSQNVRLENNIARIEKRQAIQQRLKEQISVIQSLQHSRAHVVHVFDDIVRKRPEGVTLDRMARRENEVFLDGRAKSNARISAFMTNLNTSEWFGRARLSLVNIDDQEERNLSDFKLVVMENPEQFHGINLNAGAN